VLDRLPLTSRHKLDLALLRSGRLLPAHPTAAAGPPDVQLRGALEELVASIWRDVLGLAEVGRHDNFFDRGGNSLLLVRVQSRLEAQLAREVSLLLLFQHPTIRTLAEALAGAPAEGASVQAGRARGTARRAGYQRNRADRRSGGTEG
jgi:hypothetical protein